MENPIRLLLIDPQRAFVNDGWWASHFSSSDTAPILGACQSIDLLLKNCSVPYACTKCYLEEPDSLWAVPALTKAQPLWFLKPSTNCAYSAGIDEWLRGATTLIIGGCTTTSCIRVSSTQLKRRFGLRVIVDLSLCGARKENMEPNAHAHTRLRAMYGEDVCLGKSAVDLAVLAMKAQGVEVVDQLKWQMDGSPILPAEVEAGV